MMVYRSTGAQTHTQDTEPADDSGSRPTGGKTLLDTY